MPLHLQHLPPNPDPPVPTASFMRKLNENPGRCRFFQSAAIFAGLLVVSASVVANDVPDVTGAAEDRKDGSHPAVVFPEKHRNLLQNFCFDCHDSATRKGQVDLENIPFELNSIEAAERWQKVLDVMNSGEMPPEDSAQPLAAKKTDFLEALSQTMVVARQILSDSGGVITMRRLNRREYANTIRSLLGVEVDLSDLPSDSDPGNFDTAGASLYMSSDQVEKYLKLGRQALTTLIQSHSNRKQIDLHRECEVETNRFIGKRRDQLAARHKLAEQWKASNGRPPTDFGYIDASRVKFEEGQYAKNYPSYEAYLQFPPTETGVAFTVSQAGAMVDYSSLPANAPAGEYLIRIRAGRLPNASADRSFIEYGSSNPSARTGEMTVRGFRKVTGTFEKPQIIEFPLSICHPNERKIGLRERQPNSRDAARAKFKSARSDGQDMPDPAIWIDWVEVKGPIHQKKTNQHYERLFPEAGDVDQKEHARSILRQFAFRAFRSKQPSELFLNRLVSLYEEERKSGSGFRQALITPLSVILASPSFLYLQEPNPKAVRRPLTERELAVRLSYLLWSEPPDQRLLHLANQGKLSGQATLREETERLLADPRSMEFVRSFTHQWLQMERLDFFQFNHGLYPQFDESLKMAARNEVFETFNHLLQHEKNLNHLLKSDHVIVNDLLAEYYGLPSKPGHEFESVKLPERSPRGGLLGMTAILAMGSDGERASPVERGAWVLRKILHNPPPPAPPNVPQIDRTGENLSARQLQLAHRQEPQCAQCHRKIDPIGFGMHNFDAAGQWREKEKPSSKSRSKPKKAVAQVIDPSGVLPSGEHFSGFLEMRDHIAKHEQAFARGFSESLIAYGLGRPYGFTDRDLVDHMLLEAGSEQNQISAFVHALIQSEAFKTK